MKCSFLMSMALLCATGWSSSPISGKLDSGYRVLKISGVEDQNFTVYRGDYIKFDHGMEKAHVTIPDMGYDSEIGGDVDKMAYFKMAKAGDYDYTCQTASGRIHVIEFEGVGYREMKTLQASEYIKQDHPLVLDVRTQGEYDSAHVEGALLLPVQEFQKRIGELDKYKNQPILVYCASGNRSTVASKLMIDRGFKSITNMRHGMKDWLKQGLPSVSKKP